MNSEQFEIVVCCRDLPRSFNVGDTTEFKFSFMDAVTTCPIKATLLQIVRDKMLHSSIELTVRYHIVVPEGYTGNVYSLDQFAMMAEGSNVWEGEECLGHVFSVERPQAYCRTEYDTLTKMEPIGRTASDTTFSHTEVPMYQERRTEINEKRKKLLRDQEFMNRWVYPGIALALCGLMIVSICHHRWVPFLTQIPIGAFLGIFFGRWERITRNTCGSRFGEAFSQGQAISRQGAHQTITALCGFP